LFPIKCKNKTSAVCANAKASAQEKKICSIDCFAKYFTCKTYSMKKSDNIFKETLGNKARSIYSTSGKKTK